VCGACGKIRLKKKSGKGRDRRPHAAVSHTHQRAGKNGGKKMLKKDEEPAKVIYCKSVE